MLWIVLLRFLFRLILGLALAMRLTSSRDVTSGFFRVHLWVLLGLNTFAALVATNATVPSSPVVLALAILGGVVSYGGSVCWLYECPRAGRASLLLLAACSLVGAMASTTWPDAAGLGTALFVLLDISTSALIMGATLCAMFLGHWYLNHPGMRLEPLGRLLLLILVAVLFRAAFCGGALAIGMAGQGWPQGLTLALLALRWLTGIAGLLVLAMMSRKTLEIPNTQSATGILYVGVIFAFLGELSSQLLSVESFFLV